MGKVTCKLIIFPLRDKSAPKEVIIKGAHQNTASQRILTQYPKISKGTSQNGERQLNMKQNWEYRNKN